MPDKLIVKGLGPIDGEYDCELAGMLSLGSPETLTNREGHRIKQMTGLRAGELEDAMTAGDSDLLLALAAIVLARHSKHVADDLLWDAPIGSALNWVLDQTEGDEADPPTVTPPLTGTGSYGPSGGGSSSSTSDHPGNGQNPTGYPSSGTPTSDPDYAPATSVT